MYVSKNKLFLIFQNYFGVLSIKSYLTASVVYVGKKNCVTSKMWPTSYRLSGNGIHYATETYT
jgi:hypothetical protein